jgi:hypothetical protein
VENHGPFSHVLFVQDLNIPDANPYPGSGMALITLGQIDPSAVAGYAGELVTSPLGIDESKHQTSRHILHAQYWVSAFELGSSDARLFH